MNTQKRYWHRQIKWGMLLLQKKYEEFAKYSHPTTIVMMGGQDNMLKFIRENFEQLESEGVKFLDVKFGEPTKVIPSQNEELNIIELQCTLPQAIEMSVPEGTVTAHTTLIVVSRDNGTNWYFVDVSGNDLETMRKIIPTLSSKLIIPEQQEPVFVPKEEEQKK